MTTATFDKDTAQKFVKNLNDHELQCLKAAVIDAIKIKHEKQKIESVLDSLMAAVSAEFTSGFNQHGHKCLQSKEGTWLPYNHGLAVTHYMCYEEGKKSVTLLLKPFGGGDELSGEPANKLMFCSECVNDVEYKLVAHVQINTFFNTITEFRLDADHVVKILSNEYRQQKLVDLLLSTYIPHAVLYNAGR